MDEKTATTAPAQAGLHHIAILVSDKQKALKFYEALGFAVQSCHPRPDRGDEIIFLRGYGILLEMFVDTRCPARPDQPEAYGLRHLALYVPDVEAAREHMRTAGYDPEPSRADPFSGRKLAFVKDPDGLPIEFHE